MKTILITAALALVLPACGAFAQSVIDVPSHKIRTSEAREAAPHPGPEQSERAERKNEWRMERSAESSQAGRGARFHIEDGQSKIDLRCPDGEPMRECADVLLLIIDRVQAKGSPNETEQRDDDRYQPRSQ
ncbi:hypothetical protein EPK99_18590 [Neorhizobium lilium]|uniref:Uncharacterized protein n=1 Tax=Neorhizobium lilium TaxID=2503024 RepID=A0A444LD15_9HYPH|nr:hypothetical protein [Neorhizobium lilium]RWX75698.1 hypothetical protein EPK99_18590 [Neorhizobium lilium]